MRASPRSAKGRSRKATIASSGVTVPSRTSANNAPRTSGFTSLVWPAMSQAVPSSVRVGFLGPLGTFTEQALHTQPDLVAAEHVLYQSMPDVLDAVASGEVDLGFAAIENSIDGTVHLTQDGLVFAHDLLIVREVVLDVQMCLMARPGTTLSDLKQVISIPVAIG